jgi:hypothetical protein
LLERRKLIENRSTVAPSMALFSPKNPDIAIQFLVNLSESLRSAGNPLLDAALLNILPFVSTSWDAASIHQDIYRWMYFPLRRRRSSRLSYRPHTLELLNRIRSLGLSSVVDEANQTRSWVYFLQPLF